MNKKKTRKFNILTKLVFFIGLLVFLTIFIIVLYMTKCKKEDFIGLAAEESAAVSTLLAAYIDTEKLEQVSGQGDQYYNEIQLQLNQAMEDANMEYVYTLWTDGTNVFYGVDGSMEETSEYGTLYEEPYSDLEPAFKGTVIANDDFTVYDGIHLISAFVPLKNSEGEVISVLSCDVNVEDIYAQIMKDWYSVVLYALMGLVIAGFGLHFIISITVKHIMQLDEKIEELVNSNGDLTKKIDINTGDEVEILGDSINKLLAYIRDIMINIDSSSKSLNSMANELSADVTTSKEHSMDISALMEEMSASTEETAAAIDVLTASTNDISKAVSDFANKSSEAKNYSDKLKQEANKIYNESLDKQDQAKKTAQNLEAKMNQKIEQSKAVEEIKLLISTILDITTQTNLLSLNASIEAARAGDAGRGFAVVATEIGKLAKDSADAAKKIQEVSQKVIQAVDDLALEANNMSEFVKNEALKGYEGLLSVSQQNQTNMNEISNTLNDFEINMKSVNETLSDINSNLESINVAINQNAEGISDAAASLSEMFSIVDGIEEKSAASLELSNVLEEEVHKFKI